jgi:hypothetical protein
LSASAVASAVDAAIAAAAADDDDDGDHDNDDVDDDGNSNSADFVAVAAALGNAIISRNAIDNESVKIDIDESDWCPRRLCVSNLALPSAATATLADALSTPSMRSLRALYVGGNVWDVHSWGVLCDSICESLSSLAVLSLAHSKFDVSDAALNGDVRFADDAAAGKSLIVKRMCIIFVLMCFCVRVVVGTLQIWCHRRGFKR